MTFFIVFLCWWALQGVSTQTANRCALKIQHIRHIPTRDLLCIELAFSSPDFDLSSHQVILADHSIDIEVRTPPLNQTVTLSNQVCHDNGNVGFTTDTNDIEGMKHGIYFCSLFLVEQSGQKPEFLRTLTQQVRGYLYAKDDNTPKPILCPIIERVRHIETYQIPIPDCHDGQCEITCASLCVGDGGEYSLPCQGSGCQNIQLTQELHVHHSMVIILKNGYQCVRLNVTKSRDIEALFLNEDTDLQLHTQTDDLKKRFSQLDNSFCVGTTDRYDRQIHSVWENNEMLCTAHAHKWKGQSSVNGTVGYTAITKSGYRISASKRVNFVKVDLDTSPNTINDHCKEPGIRETCKQCRPTCRAKVTDEGYIYCKDGWVHVIHDQSDRQYEHFEMAEKANQTSENLNDIQIVKIRDAGKIKSGGVKIHWIFIGILIVLICVGIIVEIVMFKSR